VIVNIDLRAYQEVIHAVRADLNVIEQQKKQITPVPELKYIETFLQTLEGRLQDFFQVLPRPDH
jgi:hypothetical protein